MTYCRDSPPRFPSCPHCIRFLASGIPPLAPLGSSRLRVCKPQRVWILRHVAMGYSVHLQRLLGGLTWNVFPYIIDGYNDHTLEGSRLRSTVFGSCEVYVRSFFLRSALCLLNGRESLHGTGVGPGGMRCFACGDDVAFRFPALLCSPVVFAVSTYYW